MEEINLKRKITLKRKGDNEGIPPPPKKSKWWLLLLLGIVVVVAVMLVVNNRSSNGIDDTVAEKIEQATTKASKIDAELQDSTSNIEEIQAQVAEAQKSIDEANENAKSDAEKQAVADAQAKVNEVAKAVDDAKRRAESTLESPAEETGTLAKVATVEPEQSKQPVSATSKPGQSTTPQSQATPKQSGQVGANNPSNEKQQPITLPQGTIEQKAIQVIRGEFGNGTDRIQALGSEYSTIQRRVNEMYRNGEVK